jgi:hypothetical protein
MLSKCTCILRHGDLLVSLPTSEALVLGRIVHMSGLQYLMQQMKSIVPMI